MFIGGLTADITHEKILTYFKRFGSISKVKLINDKNTGLCKGYGFLTCGNDLTFKRIMQQKEHRINGRIIDCNIACKKCNAPKEIQDLKKRKVFVGGLTHDTNNSKANCSKFRNAFPAF